MKKSWSIFISLLLVFVLSGCGGGDANRTSSAGNSPSDSSAKGSDTIKIGGLFSVSGGASTLGKPQLDTLKMLVEEANASGGIGGRMIELYTYDDKSDQNEAVLNMKKLLEQDNVSVVIGGTISGNALAIIPLAEKAKVPLIAVAASKNINVPTKPFVFKTAQGDDLVVPRVIQYAKEHNLTKIAWINVDNSFGSSAHEEFKNMASEAGITIVIEDVFEPSVNDAKPMLTRVKNANPQAIIIWGTAQESAIVTKNVRELGIDLPIIESHGIANSQFIELAGDAAEGIVFPAGSLLVSSQLAEDNAQKNVLEQYKKQFEDKFGYETSTFGGHVWDAFEMIKRAAETAGTDPVALRDELESGTKDLVGVSGIFTMSANNHNGLKPDALSMIEIKDKKWILTK
ncbi:ABC transporter substrate-binding protein [Paenibacillus dendritiformis]|uniref:Extracellular ligand-binding receptor n=1 Tax=Paenibacillus dendritiformis C454 TaxID=1131935 RepID=H3SPF7_9BACL|nr:ABC transporter substrate-binding protein [Paenibacillus dendritiformis]EHQ59045.1 Extracellular ligand-binding receptor [Paenibacillus dendritiformis C454]CAH8772616.1 ABC transporter substrate-binding protein [Paenibacillus dendritiformis]